MMVAPEYREAFANFAGLIDSKTGIIRSVELVKIDENDPQVFLAHASPSDTTALTDIPASNRGAACSVSRERAILRACGESVERYCSAIYEPGSLILATQAEMEARGFHCIAAKDVYAFTEAQSAQDGFPFELVATDRPTRWAPAYSLTDPARKVALAASTVYVPYLFDRQVEAWTHLPISTGLAAGPSLEFCIDKGICEILERDALMLIWAGRIEVPRIDPGTCRGRKVEVDKLLDVARPGRIEWHLSLLTLDVEMPIISAALIDCDGPVPRTAFGVSSAHDPVMAVQLAMEEAVLTRTLINRSDDVRAGAMSNTGGATTLRDHMLAHAVDWDLRRRTSFLLDDGPLITLEEVAARFADTSDAPQDLLAQAGLEAYWTEVTTADVRACNIRVARVVIPGAQPLDNDHRFRYLGGPRLLAIPNRFGADLTDLTQVNTDPHPFP